MLNSSTLRLVLLVSCCHALVHVYEHSFASVELLVADDFGISKAQTGVLATYIGFPFGFCALMAGWMADRFGAKRLLLVYLIGCSAAALLTFLSTSLGALSLAMFTLGTFASIYHPAGVGLISRQTDPENRTLALGYHGIFGSAGVAAGPFLAAMVLATGASWQQYYLVLAIPGVLLTILLILRLSHEEEAPTAIGSKSASVNSEEGAQWGSYYTLIASAVLAGIVYKAVLTFMPRYLAESGLDLDAVFGPALGLFGSSGTSHVSVANFLTGAVLMLGMFGQYTAGRIARPHTLEPFMAATFFATVPCLLWMAVADGVFRVWATGLFALMFFMHQPLYNSLVAKYVPRRRRSLAYGLSFTIGFGVGSFGSTFAGRLESDQLTYSILAGLVFVVGLFCLVLWSRNRSIPDDSIQSPPIHDEQELA